MAYKEQFFYEAKGRDIYHLKMEWVKDRDTNLLKKIIFHISFVDTHIGTPGSSNWTEGKRAEKRAKKIAEIQKYLSPSDLSLVSFTLKIVPTGVVNLCANPLIKAYLSAFK